MTSTFISSEKQLRRRRFSQGDGFAFPGFTAHVAVNLARIVGVGIQIEEYDEPFGTSGVDVSGMGRLGAEAGMAADVVAVVVGVLISALVE